MPNVQTVVIHKRKPLPLPAWVVTFTFLINLLRQGNLMAELAQRCAIPRQGGYGGFDLLIGGLAFFAAPQTGGIKGFGRAILGLASRVAEIAGLKKLPSPASLSRLLAVADRLESADEFVGWLLAQGSGCRDLLRSRLVQARDACGDYWSVHDFDPTVTAVRLRALPEGDDLPPARRRSAKTCAPGHTGRKRGQTQFSTAMLSHAGAGLWLHATVWAGNTPFAEAIGIAAAAVVRLVAWAGLDLDRTLLRFDGAGGNHPSIAAVAAHCVPYLTRLGTCHVLNSPDVMGYLSTATWVAVADSGSGPRREATELGTWVLSKGEFAKETAEAQALRTRLVVSRFSAADDNKRHGAGAIIGDWHYEVFATALTADRWPAADAVTLYYGRCGQENTFAHSGRELRLGAVHSMTIAGQRLMTAIGMWVANLQRVAAVQHQGDLGEVPAQTERCAAALPQQAAQQAMEQSADDHRGPLPDTDPAPPADATAAVAMPACPDPVAAQQLAETVKLTARATPPGPDCAGPMPKSDAESPSQLTADDMQAQVPLALTCSAGALIPLHNVRQVRGAYTYAIYRGQASSCGQCVQRQACTSRTDVGYRREFGVRIADWLMAHRDEIVRHHRLTNATTAAGAAPKSAPSPAPTAPPIERPPTPAMRLTLPKPTQPGPWHPMPACLYMPALLANWRAHLARHTVDVQVRQPPAAPPSRPWIRSTSAQRQCKRQTWTEKRRYNATTARVLVTITEHAA